MRIPTGAVGLVAAIVAVGVLGAALEVGVEDVVQVEELALTDERFESKTQLCPPGTSGGGALWAATADEEARVAFEPPDREAVPLAAQGVVRKEASEKAVDVVGYDAPITAAATLEFGNPAIGAGAAACALAASDHWYFAQGSTENGFRQRIILYNPFPEEASVRMTLYREKKKPKSPSLLSDLSVPARDHAVIDFEQATSPEFGKVATEIVASRGRIVAWRSMVVQAEGRPEGAEFSLGTSELSSNWYFPAGASDDDTFTSVYLMNPSEQEASVRVSLATPKRLLEHPSLEQIIVPPTSSLPLDLRNALSLEEIPEEFGIIVDSTAPIVAERTVGSTGTESGRSSEVGAISAAKTWSLPPVGTGAEDDRLTVLNPGSKASEVTVVLARTEGPVQPDQLQVRVKRGTSVTLSLANWQGQAPFAALVTGTRPIVVERTAQYAGDRSSAIGIPLGEN